MKNIRWSLLGWVGVAVLAVALRVMIFWVSSTHIPAFDDECKIALQAKQIARGELSLLILASPYLFPLDAYLMAPIVNLLPRNAFGARAMAFGFGLLTVVLSLLVLRRWGRWREVWPGALLILFPSAYLLTLQSGVALPGYPTLMLLSTLVIWLAQRQNDKDGRGLPIALLTGLAAGLVCSDTLLAVPVLLMGGLMIVLRRTWRATWMSLSAYSLGVLLGFLPHLAAKYVHSGAFGAVSQSIALSSAVKRLLQPALNFVLPSAFGFACPLFPDTIERLSWMSGYEMVVGIVWLLLMLAATFVTVFDFFARWRREKRPAVSAGLFFVGVSWLGLALFADSGRSHFHTYRYMIPLVWSFPFIVAWLYRSAGRAGRIVLGVLSVVWLAANAGASIELIQQWSHPGIAERLKGYDLTPVIRYLDQRGINRCHGTYVDAYRITYETDERIICSQPYNERFPGWIVPFKEQLVDPATNMAYVLSDTYRFLPEDFERDLETMGVKYRKETCGHYEVYTDFESPISSAEEGEEVTALHGAVSHYPGTASNLVDGLPTYWRCEGFNQQTGMWVEATWTGPRTIRRIHLDHGVAARDNAERMNVYLLVNGSWQKILDNVSGKPLPFDFRNNHPIYGSAVADLHLPAGAPAAEGVRLEITEPRRKFAWTLAEISVYADALAR